MTKRLLFAWILCVLVAVSAREAYAITHVKPIPASADFADLAKADITVGCAGDWGCWLMCANCFP